MPLSASGFKGVGRRYTGADGARIPAVRVLARYLLFQVPGWIVVAVAGWLLSRVPGVPGWVGPALLGGWILKDLVVYRWVRTAYDASDRPSPEGRLVGMRGVAEQDLAPEGFVRVRGELWRARAARREDRVRRGDAVRVTAASGLTVVVEPIRRA